MSGSSTPRSTSTSVLTICDGSLSAHMAGRATRLTTSLTQRFRRCTSCAGSSSRASKLDRRRGCRSLPGSPFAKLRQKLRGRHKEGIVLEDAANNHHRVCPKDVNHVVSTEFPEIVGADDRVLVTVPHFVDTRFELHNIVNVRSVFHRPVHATHDTTKGESSLGVAARQLLEDLHHPILIEMAVPKVRFGVGFELELTTLLGGCRVDTCRNQTVQVVVPLFRVNNVNRLVATPEPVLNERKQNAVLFFFTVKKCAHMTCFVELGASKRNGRRLLHRVVLLWEGQG